MTRLHAHLIHILQDFAELLFWRKVRNLCRIAHEEGFQRGFKYGEQAERDSQLAEKGNVS